ncbi:MAG TPA: hypothetical protein VHA70_04625 [Bauldia sp.]|nr:hypothetical protein [Bauldia sp.]
MSLEKIHLRKALQMLYADAKLQRTLLRRDIAEDRRRDDGEREGGGDFYSGFWADVKGHMAGRGRITDLVSMRVAANKGRARLYPALASAFEAMWNEKMRWRNEPFQFAPQSLRARLNIPELQTTLKIENTISVIAFDGSPRIIYPYFSEKPALPDEGARVGLALLATAFPGMKLADFRLVDVLRRGYFRPSDLIFDGGEREIFVEKYRALLALWRSLGGK